MGGGGDFARIVRVRASRRSFARSSTNELVRRAPFVACRAGRGSGVSRSHRRRSDNPVLRASDLRNVRASAMCRRTTTWTSAWTGACRGRTMSWSSSLGRAWNTRRRAWRSTTLRRHRHASAGAGSRARQGQAGEAGARRDRNRPARLPGRPGHLLRGHRQRGGPDSRASSTPTVRLLHRFHCFTA